MPNSPGVAIQNMFNGGLKTEFTGLNFPENSCTELSNCVISLIGDVLRRGGIDYELNAVLNSIDRTNAAISTYRWTNVGGDGLTQVVVVQVGGNLYFFQQTNATVAQPLSTTLLASVVNLSPFLAAGSTANPAITECQFTDGNGILFVFHPNLDPIYCVFNAGVITATVINIQIRDFNGVLEPSVPFNFRPNVLTNEHQYNLVNQGWSNTPPWTASSSSMVAIPNAGASVTWTVTAGIAGISNGQNVNVYAVFSPPVGNVYSSGNYSGTVTNYAGTQLTLTINSGSPFYPGTAGLNSINWSFSSVNTTGQIGAWHSAIGNYPSNADVWWYFKNSSDVFDPAGTINSVTLANAPAPKGAFVLNAFSQKRSTVSGITGLTDVITTIRPKTGTWFQGRVFYTGVDASSPAAGDASYTTWTENIYFSQIVVPGNTNTFGYCYQVNDPTSQNLFDLLPTDGGVIVIQGSGSIYKLFPLQTGLLVFAANGIWFITGSQGGFAADGYTISKISNVQSITSTAFINILGYPMFWNEEGIYHVVPSKQAGSQHTPDIGLDVENICVGTILSFYSQIPVQSKKFARGDYNAVSYVVSWIYRSTNESSTTDRYQFDSQLNFNTVNKAFYPYSISNSSSSPYVHDIKYIVGPGGSTSPDPTFKYLSSIFTNPGYGFTFSEERDNTHFTDWFTSGTSLNFVSNFIAGYNIKGQAQQRWQPGYVYVFSNNSSTDYPTGTAYLVNGIFDYGAMGKTSSVQMIVNDISSPTFMFRRHRIRGRGLAFQLAISSVDGQPFDIIGWSIWTNINTGV